MSAREPSQASQRPQTTSQPAIAQDYVIAEAIDDGEQIERLRVRSSAPVAPGEPIVADDPGRIEAERWARDYSDRTRKPTVIEVVWRDTSGATLATQNDFFYYHPEYPERDPHNQSGY